MREDNIQKLKSLIQEYEEESERLNEMIKLWENGDPLSDPGLQYEQGYKINKAYESIVNYVKNSM